MDLPGSILNTFTATCGTISKATLVYLAGRTDLCFAFTRLDGTSINLAKRSIRDWGVELANNLRCEIGSSYSAQHDQGLLLGTDYVRLTLRV